MTAPSPHFQAFSPTHLWVLGGFAVLTAGMVLARRALRDDRHRLALDRAVALAGLATIAVFTAWWLMPARYDRVVSWPLHVCDVAGVIAVVALWTGRRRWRVVLHYWGLGLCTEAIITPTLSDGPADLGFWLFWASHALIVGAALYDVFARGFRPRWRDCGFAVVVSLAYLVVILPLDVALDLNYGYLGRSTPEHPTLLDLLGPWPGRVVLIVLGMVAVFVLMTLPWELGRRFLGWESAAGEREVAATDAV